MPHTSYGNDKYDNEYKINIFNIKRLNKNKHIIFNAINVIVIQFNFPIHPNHSEFKYNSFDIMLVG